MSIESVSAVATPAATSIAANAKGSASRQQPPPISNNGVDTRKNFPASSTAEANRQQDRQSTNSQSDTPLEDAVQKLGEFVSSIRSEISFSIDEASGTRVVKVLDSQSKEVIRQIPSEEAIQLAQALDKLQGLFVREKA